MPFNQVSINSLPINLVSFTQAIIFISVQFIDIQSESTNQIHFSYIDEFKPFTNKFLIIWYNTSYQRYNEPYLTCPIYIIHNAKLTHLKHNEAKHDLNIYSRYLQLTPS